MTDIRTILSQDTINIPQIETPEEKTFYLLVQTAKSVDDLVLMGDWLNKDAIKKTTVKNYPSSVSNEARILILREMMYNEALEPALRGLTFGNTKQRETMGGVINLLLKDNEAIDMQMYKSLLPEDVLRPRVYHGDTIAHIAGRMGYFDILSKILRNPEGCSTLTKHNASGLNPLASINSQVRWVINNLNNLSYDENLEENKRKELEQALDKRYKSLKDCADACIGQANMAILAHAQKGAKKKWSSKTWKARTLGLLFSCCRDGIRTTAANEVEGFCNTLIDKNAQFIGVNPSAKPVPVMAPKESVMDKVARHMPNVYGGMGLISTTYVAGIQRS